MYEEEYELMHEEDRFTGARYTIHYEGYLFYGDSDGWNHHDYDRWDDIAGIVEVYLGVWVEDNYYGVRFANGDWI